MTVSTAALNYANVVSYRDWHADGTLLVHAPAPVESIREDETVRDMFRSYLSVAKRQRNNAKTSRVIGTCAYEGLRYYVLPSQDEDWPLIVPRRKFKYVAQYYPRATVYVVSHVRPAIFVFRRKIVGLVMGVQYTKAGKLWQQVDQLLRGQ